MANHWADNPETLPEILHHCETYVGEDYWQAAITKFCRMGVDERTQELVAFERKMADQISPNRETAEIITKFRELQNLHRILQNSGR